MTLCEKSSRNTGWLIIFLSLYWACSDPFSFSPFEADVQDAFRNTTEINLDKLRQLDTTVSRPFKVALISDSHYHFTNLADAIADINRQDGFSFIIVTGDISENGLQKEFEIFHRIMSGAHIPWLTVIGNHDHLSNGAVVYRQMFGPLNYSFAFHRVKFVAWDNTIWESNRKEADFQWLNETLQRSHDEGASSEPYHHIIPFSHIPPFDGQLKPNGERFHEILKVNGVKLSVHGHKHEFSTVEMYEDSTILYVTVGSPQNRHYAELSITPDETKVRKIEY